MHTVTVVQKRGVVYKYSTFRHVTADEKYVGNSDNRQNALTKAQAWCFMQDWAKADVVFTVTPLPREVNYD